MITDEARQAVVQSWRLVVPIADTAVDLFYGRLFELRPDYRSFFPSDMQHLKKKLLQMLAFIVRSLDWSAADWRETPDAKDDLFLVVLALGRRHRALYKVPDDAYEPVGEALLWALRRGLGEAFTPEVREAWAQTYDLVSRTMKMGAAAVVAEGGR